MTREEEIDLAANNRAFEPGFPYKVAAAIKGFKEGANWADEHPKNFWKQADGDDLPEYEREVIVFTQNFTENEGLLMVCIAHRPNPDGWDGKSLSNGKVEHYTPKTYDKGGWNIPDVKYWLDLDLPELEE